MSARRRFFPLLLACWALSGCAGGEISVPMPPELMGRWITADVDYAGRFFELTGNTVTLGTGGAVGERHLLSAVALTVDEKGSLYAVRYRDRAGIVHTMSFYYDAAGAGTIRMKNQPDIAWRKAGRP